MTASVGSTVGGVLLINGIAIAAAVAKSFTITTSGGVTPAETSSGVDPTTGVSGAGTTAEVASGSETLTEASSVSSGIGGGLDGGGHVGRTGSGGIATRW